VADRVEGEGEAMAAALEELLKAEEAAEARVHRQGEARLWDHILLVLVRQLRLLVERV